MIYLNFFVFVFIVIVVVVSGFGQVDITKSARLILKDMCAGKLLYCHPPPELVPRQRERFYASFTVENIMSDSLGPEPAIIPVGRQKKVKDKFDNFLKNPVMKTEAQQRAYAEAKARGENVEETSGHGLDIEAELLALTGAGASGANTGAASSTLQQDDLEEAIDIDIDAVEGINVAVNRKKLTKVDLTPKDELLREFMGQPIEKKLSNKQKRIAAKQRRAEGRGLMKKARRRQDKANQQGAVQGFTKGGVPSSISRSVMM